MEKRVDLTIKNNIAYVTMVREDKYNALNSQMIDDLITTAESLKDNKDIRAVILSGKGKAFCSGLDFPSFQAKKGEKFGSDMNDIKEGVSRYQNVAWAWRKLDVPVIAAIHGFCFGGGAQIALGADFRFITPDCQFSIMESKWGLIPDMSLTVSIRELMSIDQAKYLTMTGIIISGTETKDYNLSTAVGKDPMAMAEKLAETITTRSPDCIVNGKKLFQQTWTAKEENAFAIERTLQQELMQEKKPYNSCYQ